MTAPLDCLVVGGGPAGLTAAIYLARFRRGVLVADGGDSRAAWIPRSHNHAGFPGGVNGQELLDRLHCQLGECGTAVERVSVCEVRIEDGLFHAKLDDGQQVEARTLLLATGVVNNRPDLPAAEHDRALEAGLLRYCPVCDGTEVIDQAVGVIGADRHGAAEAMFIRTFTPTVTLFPRAEANLDGPTRARLGEAGVEVVDSPAHRLQAGTDAMHVELDDGRSLRFDTVYAALGSDIRSGLAASLGVALDPGGCIRCDPRQATSVPGVWAAGDVVSGLDQISVAIGQAAIAATAIHNHLREAEGRCL